MTQRRAERLNQIVECLSRAGQAGMSRREISECLGLKMSPYIIDLVEFLVRKKYATKALDGNVYPATFRYFLIEREK